MYTLARNLQGIIIVIIVLSIGGVLLIQNRTQPRQYAIPVGGNPTYTQNPVWMSVLEQGIDNSLTRVPTETPYVVEYVPPSPIGFNPSITPISLRVTQVAVSQLTTPTPLPTSAFSDDAIPTFTGVGSTPVPSPTGLAQDVLNFEAVAQFQPPPEQLPLSLQPYDHFFFTRPVDASGNSASLFYYTYGSRWQGTARVHHGIDIPNPIGEQVLAAADGTVFYSGIVSEDGEYEGMELYASYGNFIVIEHDFTVKGKPVYTLYAHLAARLVAEGERVQMNDVIGLVGNTGIVTGPHVHFEVRYGENSYWSTRNPLLWIAPYLGHGVIAGRITDENGDYIDEVSVQLIRGGRTVDRTVTYAQPYGGTRRPYRVVPDDNWQENYVFGDVPEGVYQVVTVVNGRRFQQTVEVRAGMVNWVEEFRLNPPESTPLPTISSTNGSE
ncbi:MAG: hypothetical protein CUN55_09190 [Phototrophicales bacterium]|nr:MAG: hypothetical protein CUN55_09190 [Phototrophicales bacterium]